MKFALGESRSHPALVACAIASCVIVMLAMLAAAPVLVKRVVTAYPLGEPMPKRPAVVEVPAEATGVTLCGGYFGNWVVCVANIYADGRRSAWACDTLISWPTGIEPDRPPRLRASICPNPTGGEITILSPVEGDLEIFDVAGRHVGSIGVSVGIQRDQVSLPAGTYFWRLGTARGRLTIIR